MLYTEEILDRFDQFTETTDAIVKDYEVSDGAMVELGIAEKNFINDLKDLLDRLQLTHKNEIAEVKTELEDFKKETEGWAQIKIQTEDQRQKLLDFVQAEIYPFVNDKEHYRI